MTDDNLEIQTSKKFDDYLLNLNDLSGKTKILARITRLSLGNWGDASPVGEGVTELRINYGPGYRVYCRQIGQKIVILLGAGTKKDQQSDINAAKADAKNL